MSVTHQIRINGNEILPIADRASWIDRHGPIDTEVTVSLQTSLRLWERFGATIRSDGSIELKDLVLMRTLQTILCRELRENPRSRKRTEDETNALLDLTRFSAICERLPLPKDSFPEVGADYELLTTPWFLHGDPRIPWSEKGKEYQFGLRVVYERRVSDGSNGNDCDSPPEIIAVDGPFELAQFEALTPVGPNRYGRLLARAVGKD